jgi:hypothetical protein
MNRRRSSGMTSGILALVCIVLVAAIYLELAEPGKVAPALQQEPDQPPPTPREPSAISMPPQEAFSAVLERPVFSSTRRPVPGSEIAPDSPALSDLDLIGIVVSSGDRFVLVKQSGASQPQPAREGEIIGGWSILSISEDHVILRRGANEIEVALDYAEPAPPPPPRAPNAAPSAGDPEPEKVTPTGDVSPGEAPAQ